jgi:hypothetical protein
MEIEESGILPYIYDRHMGVIYEHRDIYIYIHLSSDDQDIEGGGGLCK